MSLRDIDFLRPVGPPRLGWWLLAAGALAVAGTVWCDQRWVAERRQAEQALQARNEAARATRRPVARPTPSAADQRLQRAAVELRRPWMATLRAIEFAAVDPVYLVSLTIEPTTGAIKLEADAPSFEHALAFTQVLADGAVLPSATLASHEQAVDPAGGAGHVRFTALSHWSAP